MPLEPESRTAPEVVLDPIKGQPGAISMAVEPGVASGDVTFQVTVGSFTQPYCKVDDTGTPIAMALTLAPSDPETAGEWQATMGPLTLGPHEIICYNGTTRARHRVFAGAYPAWDAGNVLDHRRDPIEDAAAIGATTGRLG
jgi:hypothetical protein